MGMQVISLANQKGGVGKTTLSCLLAFYLSDKLGARVLAVDLDNQRNLSHTLADFASGVPTTALFEASPVQLAIDASLILIAGTPQLANLERATAEEAKRRVRQFSVQLQALSARFDYCVLDPPPTLGIRMVAALASSDFVAMPIELEEYSTQAVTDMLQTVFGVREQWNPKLKFLGMIANRFMHNSVRQKAALRDLMQNYPQYLLPCKISTRAAIPRALEEHRGVWQLATPAARDASQEVLRAFEALLKGTAAHVDTPGEVA
jgi:chromosome partitioning protein